MAREDRISFEVTRDLRKWLEDAAAVLPEQPGKPGRKGKLSEYLRIVLEAHKAGAKPVIPQPDPDVREAGDWFVGLPVPAQRALLSAALAWERPEWVEALRKRLLSGRSRRTARRTGRGGRSPSKGSG
jgi:hypothetical protein